MRFDVYHHFDSQTDLVAAIHTLERKVMSAISDFQTRVNAKLEAIGTGIDGIDGDVKFLKEQIAALQASVGTVTPEDQAIIDAMEARIGTLADRVTAVDAETAPLTPA